MTIDLSKPLELELRRLAGSSGKDIGILVEEAIRQYLDASAITDVSADEVAATQASLLGELTGVPAWRDGPEPPGNEAC